MNLRTRATIGLPSLTLLAVAVAVVMAVSATGAAALAAQDAAGPPQISPEARQVAKEAIGQIRSPFCPGFMLEVCTSPQAAHLRDSIRVWADQEGATTEGIVEQVIAEWGEEYRALPKPTGRGLLAWLAPPIAFLIGLVLVVFALRRLRETAPKPASVVTSADEDMVREALAELERAEGPVG